MILGYPVFDIGPGRAPLIAVSERVLGTVSAEGQGRAAGLAVQLAGELLGGVMIDVPPVLRMTRGEGLSPKGPDIKIAL